MDVSEPKGKKFDQGKPEYGLLPVRALGEVVDVLTFGAQKYGRGNWKDVPDAGRRYFDAMQRHVWQYKQDQAKNHRSLDLESNKHHLAHAICCLMFLLEKDLQKDPSSA